MLGRAIAWMIGYTAALACIFGPFCWSIIESGWDSTGASDEEGAAGLDVDVGAAWFVIALIPLFFVGAMYRSRSAKYRAAAKGAAAGVLFVLALVAFSLVGGIFLVIQLAWIPGGLAVLFFAPPLVLGWFRYLYIVGRSSNRRDLEESITETSHFP